ncbi:ANTAR domain-containing response regulator [Butyrivibrio sp. YAB3001]|uniref:ANTAR domain-containing response regulator n=1 Tax=Butyrivibrio sp. YAB3001 TaxID=1520812 RepID=UPI0008F6519F|nr:ANTAR domain-containing protein [Butyrivibrio sp. YAB3001]SFB86289.1 response regulator receiver and ANTAR domain protein [Butyrivibrio sp. YAB3001]
MPKKQDIQHSILIVSSSEQFVLAVKRSLVGFITIDTMRTVSLARRSFLEKNHDIIVIDTPLPDETGVEFAMDISEKSNSSILLVAPQEVFDDVVERVIDQGVYVISKPVSARSVDKAIRYLVATQNRMQALTRKTLTVEEKMEEIRVVSKAKILLVEKKHMSEDEAHRFIGKQAMNHGVSRKRIAEKILDDLE